MICLSNFRQFLTQFRFTYCSGELSVSFSGCSQKEKHRNADSFQLLNSPSHSPLLLITWKDREHGKTPLAWVSWMIFFKFLQPEPAMWSMWLQGLMGEIEEHVDSSDLYSLCHSRNEWSTLPHTFKSNRSIDTKIKLMRKQVGITQKQWGWDECQKLTRFHNIG